MHTACTVRSGRGAVPSGVALPGALGLETQEQHGETDGLGIWGGEKEESKDGVRVAVARSYWSRTLWSLTQGPRG